MVEKRVKKFGQGSPPPFSGNAQKKNFFYMRASLTCMQNHFDHQRPELSEFRHRHVAQDEAVVVLHRLEEGGHVVVLEDRPVVVQKG